MDGKSAEPYFPADSSHSWDLNLRFVNAGPSPVAVLLRYSLSSRYNISPAFRTNKTPSSSRSANDSISIVAGSR